MNVCINVSFWGKQRTLYTNIILNKRFQICVSDFEYPILKRRGAGYDWIGGEGSARKLG